MLHVYLEAQFQLYLIHS